MESILKDGFFFGEEILNQMHLFIGGWFDNVMIVVTYMGDELFYVALLPIAYWVYDRGVVLKVGVVFLLSATLNDMLKFIYMNPRPDAARLLEGIKELNMAYLPKDPGFPSGHTQGSVSFWGAAMYFMRTKPVMIIGILMMLLVPYSRLYLAVHHFGDVIGGYVLGIASLIVFIPMILIIQKNYDALHDMIILSALMLVPLLLFFVLPGEGISHTLGVLSGMLIGAYLARERIAFNPRNGILPNIVKVIVGMAILFAVKDGVKIILPKIPMADFFRYWLIGAWVSFGAPFLFSKIARLKGDAFRSR